MKKHEYQHHQALLVGYVCSLQRAESQKPIVPCHQARWQDGEVTWHWEHSTPYSGLGGSSPTVVSLYTDLPLVFASRCVVPTLAADLEISTQPKRSASTHAVTSQQFAARPVFVSTKETSLIQTLYEEAVLHLLLFYWETFFLCFVLK